MQNCPPSLQVADRMTQPDPYPSSGRPEFEASERLRYALDNMPLFLVCNLAAVCVTALVHAGFASTTDAGFWALPGIVLSTAGWFIWSRTVLTRHMSTSDRRLVNVLRGGALLTGLHWGLGGAWLMDIDNTASVLFTILSSIVVGCGGAIALSVSRRAIAALLLPLMAGMTYPFLVDAPHLPTAGVIVALFCLIYLLALYQRRLLSRDLRRNAQNRSLILGMKEARDMLNDALESLPVGIILCDEHDRLILANRQVRELFPKIGDLLAPGTSFEKLVRAHIERGGFPIYTDLSQEDAIEKRLVQHRAATGSFELTTQDGRVIRGTDTPAHNGGVISVYVDVTELRVRESEIRQNRDRLALVLDATEDGYWEVDVRKKTSYWSRRFREILGVDNTAIPATENNFLALLHPTDRNWVRDTLQQASVGDVTTFDIEYRIVSPNGSTRWIHDRGKSETDENGDIVRIAGAAADITDRVQKTRERDAALDALERQNIELEQFVTIASHDLQEPLRMMTGYLDLLRRRAQGKLDEEGLEYLDYSLQSGKRMQQLIRDLLDYSRIGTRGARMERTGIEASVEEARLNLSLLIQESNAEISVSDTLPEVIGDHSQLVQLFQNLIGNAIKYRRDGEIPRISISAVDNRGEWIIKVVDNGIGIDPADQTRIFGIFQRLHGRSAYPGTGMGLAICRKIVERHHGRIWVESEIGEGAAFCFSLPTLENGAQATENAA
jgi:PAS domain S-box-containing protein